MALPRMRTAAGVLEEIKKIDPESGLTLHYIRALILAEAVPVVVCGRKKLVDVDALMDLLGSGYVLKAVPSTVDGIRKIL